MTKVNPRIALRPKRPQARCRVAAGRMPPGAGSRRGDR